MRNFSILSLAVLAYLCDYVLAAPPINLPSSGTLSITNLNSASPALTNITISRNITVSTVFPPGKEPPDVFFYDVPNSNPHINLKFKDYTLIEDRDETECAEAIQKAISAAGDPTKYDVKVPEFEHTYAQGDNLLDIIPKKGYPDQTTELTWGIWSQALTGVSNFRLAYPGLYFVFEVYVYPGGSGDENYVGIGELGWFISTADEIHLEAKREKA